MKPARVMRLLTGVATAALFIAPAASAAEHLILNPDWVQKPDGKQMGWSYPPMAASLAIEGETLLSCDVAAEGLLRNCRIVKESPSGLGFAAATLSLTQYFRLSPKMVDGRGVTGGTVRIPLHFKLPDPPSLFSPGPPTSVQALKVARELVIAEKLHDFIATGFSAESPAFANWRRPGLDAATEAAGREALSAAFEIESKAWLESIARTYAAQFTAEQLAARLAFMRSPGGEALALRQADLEALDAPISWVAFQVGMKLGRTSFCETHACVRDPDAQGKAAPEPEPSITKADWIETPTRAQVIEAIPFLARPLKLAGEAKLSCGVSVIGSLSGCKVLYETPTGFGFGEAAVKLAGYYHAQPLPPDLAPQSPTVELLVRFPELPTQYPLPQKMPVADEKPSDARLNLAHKLVAANGFDAAVAQKISRDMKGFDEIPSPGVDGRTRADVRDALAKGMTAAALIWRESRARHYASLFQEAELKDMLDWELSPAAQAFRDQQPRSAEAAFAQAKLFSAVVEKHAGRIFCAKRDCKSFVQPDKSEAGYKPPKP